MQEENARKCPETAGVKKHPVPAENGWKYLVPAERMFCGLNGPGLLETTERKNVMKRVITYGTFDLLHYGHINLLKRAKSYGDYLIVAISSDAFNENEKHKKCYFTYEQRKALVEAVRYVDLVIPEETWTQKRSDMHEYHIDTFVMGDDWKGKFDFLKEEGVEVVYLPRTPEVSSTRIRQDLYDAASVEKSLTSHEEIDTDPVKG